jgi:hypothetical protein
MFDDFIIILNMLMVMILLNIIIINHYETNYYIILHIFYNMEIIINYLFIESNALFIEIIMMMELLLS